MGRFGGRPRQAGARYPSGDIKRKKPGEGVTPAAWGRIKNFFAKQAEDSRLDTEVGRLSFAGELTNAQAAAAFKIGDVYRNYHRAKNLKDFPKSPNYERGYGDADLAEERMSWDELDRHEAWIRKCTEAWEKLDTHLATAPRELRQAMLDVCVFSTPTNPLYLPGLRMILDDLAKRWEQGWKDQPQRPPDLRLRPARGDNVGTLSRRRRDRLAGALDTVLKKVAPHLDEAGRKWAIETVHALSARDAFRDETKNKAQ